MFRGLAKRKPLLFMLSGLIIGFTLLITLIHQEAIAERVVRVSVAPALGKMKESSRKAVTEPRGDELYAVELDSPLLINGTVERWPYIGGAPETKHSFSKKTDVVFHPERWKGEEDLSAKICAGWNEQNLYFTFRIRDEQVVFAKNPEQLLKSDHVEIWLDTQLDADKEDARMSRDDQQLAIGMIQDGQPIVADWTPRRKRNEVLELGVKAAFQKNAEGYVAEVAIPLALLRINPIQDWRIGILLDVSDTDDANNPRQDKLLSSSQKRRFRDPTSFNTLRFTFIELRWLPPDQTSMLDKYELGLAKRIVAAMGNLNFSAMENVTMEHVGFGSQITRTSCSVEEVHFTNPTAPDLIILMSVRSAWSEEMHYGYRRGIARSKRFLLKKEQNRYEMITDKLPGLIKPIDINEKDGVVEFLEEDILYGGFYMEPNESDVVIHKYVGGKMREIWRVPLERSNNLRTARFENKYELVRSADSDYKAIRLTLKYGIYPFDDRNPVIRVQQAENIYVWDGEKYVPEGKEHTIDELRARAASALIIALNDEDEFVRKAAAEELRKIDTPEARKALEYYKGKK